MDATLKDMGSNLSNLEGFVEKNTFGFISFTIGRFHDPTLYFLKPETQINFVDIRLHRQDSSRIDLGSFAPSTLELVQQLSQNDFLK